MPEINELPDQIVNSKEEERTVSYLKSLLKDAVKDRLRFEGDWQLATEFFQNKQWEHEGPINRSRASINLCSKVIRATTPLLTDKRPMMEVLPTHPDHYALADVFHAAIQYVMYDQQFLRKLARNMVISQCIGTCFFEVVWDPELDMQRGGIALRIVSPWNVLALGSDDVQDCEVVAIRRRMPMAKLRRLYPDRAHLVQPEVDASTAAVRPKLTSTGASRLPVTIDTGGRVDTYNQGFYHPQEFQEATWVWEIYFRDPSTDSVIEEVANEDGEFEETIVDRLKYPAGWRMITMAGNTILADNPLPYKHYQVPLVKITNMDVPEEFWGEGDLKSIITPNRIINLVLSQILDAIRLGNNPPLLVPAGSGLNINNWINYPGIIAQYNAQYGAPHWMEPQKLDPVMIQVLEMCLKYVYELSGISEISEGALPFKGASGELVAQLREAAMTRIRLKVQNLEDGLSQVGKQILGLVQQFWTGFKMLRVSGLLPEEKLQRTPNIILGQDGKAAFLPVNQNIPGPGGTPIKLNDLSQGQYDVRVVTGSTLAESHRQKMQDALSMMHVGIYTPEDVVTVMDDPRKDIILGRLRMQAAMAQQMAAMGGAPVPTGESAGPPAGAPPGPMPGGGGPPQPLPENLGGASTRV